MDHTATEIAGENFLELKEVVPRTAKVDSWEICNIFANTKVQEVQRGDLYSTNVSAKPSLTNFSRYALPDLFLRPIKTLIGHRLHGCATRVRQPRVGGW